jgi:predicted amidophosphoribosyltransferase
MDATCSNCKAQLPSSHWSFCPHCGTAVTHEAPQPQEHRRHPARGAFGGLVYGLIAAPILIIAGVMICLTGWGIFFGVPVILLGILAPLAGPIFGMSEHTAKCPACGTRVLTLADGKMHACPTCMAQFAVDAHPLPHAH